MKKYKVLLLAFLMCLLTACVPRNCIEEGSALIAERRYDEAIKVFEESIEKNKELGAAYKGIAIAQYETEQYEAALVSFDMAFQHGADKNPVTLNLVGISNMKLEKYAEALAEFGLAIELAEKKPEKYAELLQELKYNEIICYERIADWKTAKAKVLDYLELYPDDEAMQKEGRFLKTR